MKNGQWIVFKRRRHAQLDFNRNWTDYEEGFGDPQYEHWLGLKKINCLTFSICAAELRIDMTDYKGIHKYAIYSSIAVNNAANKYRLDLGAYSGTAGDGMRACGSSINHDGMPFSTPDRDNENDPGNCVLQSRMVVYQGLLVFKPEHTIQQRWLHLWMGWIL